MTALEQKEELAATAIRAGGFSHKALAALAVAALGYAAAFVSGIVTARTLGATGKGILSLFLTTIAGLSAVSSLGLGQGQIYHAAKAPAKLRFFMPHAAVLSAVLGGGSALLYLRAEGWLGSSNLVHQLGSSGFLAVLMAVPLWSFVTFQRQYLLTVSRYTFAKAIGSLGLAAPLIAVAAAYAITGRVTLGAVIWGVVLIQGMAALVSQVALRAPVQGPSFSVAHLKESFSFGIRQWASEVTHFLTSRLDFFVVAWLLGSSGLGIYSVAVGLAETVSRLAYELGTMMFPAVAAGNLRPGLAPALLRTAVAAATAMALLLGVLAAPLVTGLYGPPFAEAVRVLQVLLIGTVAWSAAQILWLYASGAGRLEFVLLVLGGAAALDLALNLVLLPRLGVLGAGLASTISYCVAAAALLPLFCRREGCTIREALLVTVSDLRRLGTLISELPSRGRMPVGS